MSEMYPPPPPPPADQNRQHPGADAGQNPPPPGNTWPQPFQPQQPPAGGPVPSQPYYPQWPPTQGTAPSQPLYPQQPPMIPGAYPSQPLYPQQPYMGAAPSQPLYPQQPPVGYTGYTGYPGGAPIPPTYVRTNLGEYWKNAKNGKRNISILAVLTILFFMCGGLSSGFHGDSANANSTVLSTSGQGSATTSDQSNGQGAGAPQPTYIPLPTDTPVPPPTPVPTESPAQYKASAKSVTVADIAKDPNTYKGKTVKFTAVIANFVHDSNGNTAGANVLDPNDYSSVIQIAFTPDFSLAHVNKGDTIQVWGQGLGAFSGTNAFGATITEGAVQEVYLHDSTTGYSDNTVTDPSSFVANLPN